MRQQARTTLLALFCAISALAAEARGQDSEPLLPWVFADHMVLQCDRPISVWGRASPGVQVRVRFGADSAATRADTRGDWRIELPPQPATSIGRDLFVDAGDREAQLRDVVVGEVWLCAGQSNMDLPLSRATGSKLGIRALQKMPQIRFCNRTGSPSGFARALTDEQLTNITPDTFYSGTWQRADHESTARFSAVAAYFGRVLRLSLDVPIGLIDLSIGGSTTEGWISRERLAKEADLAPLLEDHLATHLSHPFIRERTRTQLASWVAAGEPDPRPRHFFDPGFLFKSAIEPLAPFTVRGVLWYQGESNAHMPRIADRLFRMMVEEWRDLWAQPELPFYFVQLPAMGRSDWPEFREMQAGWLDIPHTGMAVTIDVGHPTDVHPRKKRAVGERLARIALADTYGKDVVASGPRHSSARRDGRKLVLTFESTEDLRWAEGRTATGFEIAGADRRFHEAEAEIRDGQVVLTAKQVSEPIDARYAWAPVPEWSLTDASGLPAAPFRTQAWRPVRIACIGDSITAGFGLKSPATESYPAQLQELLGDGFEVRNFGHSGCCVVLSTMRGDWARAYRRNPEHLDALAFEPQIVISNLGINDIMAWPQRGGEFVGDYARLIEDYRALASSPRILLWSPLAPLFPGQKFYGSADEPRIHRAIDWVARNTSSSIVDMNTALRNQPQWFPDHIHPNADGSIAIARLVHEALLQLGLVKR